MCAITGESVFHCVSKIIVSDESPITYFQYRDLLNFLEIVAFHEEIIILQENEQDVDYVNEYKWLLDEIKKRTNIKITFLDKDETDIWENKTIINDFNDMLTKIYKHDFGISIKELLKKQKSDRSEKEESFVFESVLKYSLQKNDLTMFSDFIYESWLNNQYNQFIFYLLRAHFIKTISINKNYTPFYDNYRLFSELLERDHLTNDHIGTLPFLIYSIINSNFIKILQKLPLERDYPIISILLRYLLNGSSKRIDILNNLLTLYNNIAEFRNNYLQIDLVLRDQNQSISRRQSNQSFLNDSLTKILVPTITSFGKDDSRTPIKKFFKTLSNQYGVGDIKYEIKLDTGEEDIDSTKYSTPSLTGFGLNVIKGIYSTYKDSKLLNANRPMLDLIVEIFEKENTLQNCMKILPIKDYPRSLNVLIEKNTYK